MDNLTGIFDTHAHYDDKKFKEDLEDVLIAQRKNGVNLIINAGCSIKSSKKSIELANKYNFIYAAVGIHPHEAEDESQSDYVNEIKQLTDAKKVVAIGEIGLDYHYDFSPREIQKDVFKSILSLAKDVNKPVIIHSREATNDMNDILNEYRPKGVVHCFTGSKETVLEHLKLGLYIGFTGVVTFSNAKKVLEAIKVTPLDKILLETDCPYMAPVPHRGKRTTSDMIKYTAKVISDLKGIPTEDLIKIASDNGKLLFNL